MPSTIRHQYAGPTSGARSCTRPSRSSAGESGGSAASASAPRPSLFRWRSGAPRLISHMTALQNAVTPTVSEPAGRSLRRAGSGALTLRVLSGFVAVPFLLGVAYVGNPIYGAFICIASAYAALEVRGMLRAGGYVPIDWALVGLSALLPLSRWLAEYWQLPDGITLVTGLAIGGLVSLLIRPTSERSLVDWALSIALAVYLGG